MVGRERLGERVMTPAERQTRYRARRRCNPQRWDDAGDELSVAQKCREWLEALLERLGETPSAEFLRSIDELDRDSLDTEPPRGFSRDV
jgi:hypothetical protein